LRNQHPALPLVVAGDDDPTKPGNPGRSKAEAAAAAVGGVAVFPVIPGEGGGGDWNDLHVGWGIEAVEQQLEAAFDLATLPRAPSEGEGSAPAGSSSDSGGAGE